MDPWLVSAVRGAGAATRPVPPAADDIAVAADNVADMTAALNRVAATVAACRRCVLCETRTRTVFARGDSHAACMVIGEAPGAEEDRRGEPFVGRAGQLLDAMLAAIGLPHNTAYIANILKCRPPGNRNPAPDEVAACADYLAQQIKQVAPRLILAVGRIAAHALLDTDKPLAGLRGHVHTHPGSGLPLVVSYHPAYLLRSPSRKAHAWQDLLKVRELLNRI